MFSTFEWMVAIRYLQARRQEGFISIIAGFSLLGITLGVATLIIVMAVMNGFRQELLDRILGLNGHMLVYPPTGQDMQDYDSLAHQLQNLTIVSSAAPAIHGQALLSVNGHASGVVVRGVAQEDFLSRPILSHSLINGDPADFTGNTVAIGTQMAWRLGLQVNDHLTLISPQGKPTAFGTLPRIRSYRIAVIFDVGMYEYDNHFVFMPLESAQIFFQMRDKVTTVELFLEDPNHITQGRSLLFQEIPDHYRLIDWQQQNRSFFNALEVERNVMFLILTMIILVAAFNIISSLIMLVKDKGKGIAILRTMGATRMMLVKIFILIGASVGVIGTLLGLIVGVAFCENIESIRQFLQGLTGVELFAAEIYFLSTMPAEMEWHEVLQVAIMALFLSFAATIYPSWRVAQLDPVEALRYE